MRVSGRIQKTGGKSLMQIPGNLLTTAMAVMPHKDADRAKTAA